MQDPFDRFQELVLKAAHGPNGQFDVGVWEHADYDEILAIAELLSEKLPKQAHQILSSSFPNYAELQKTMANRLLRLMEIDQKYGRVASSNESTELSPTFELKEEDKMRVLHLTGQMRQIVFASELFDAPHKRRLLNRIAAMENAVHQPKGKLDVILAGASDIGDTLRKFGGDLKPLTDRYLEVKRITQRSSSEYAQIPPPEELQALPPPED